MLFIIAPLQDQWIHNKQVGLLTFTWFFNTVIIVLAVKLFSLTIFNFLKQIGVETWMVTLLHENHKSKAGLILTVN